MRSCHRPLRFQQSLVNREQLPALVAQVATAPPSEAFLFLSSVQNAKRPPFRSNVCRTAMLLTCPTPALACSGETEARSSPTAFFFSSVSWAPAKELLVLCLAATASSLAVAHP